MRYARATFVDLLTQRPSMTAPSFSFALQIFVPAPPVSP